MPKQLTTDARKKFHEHLNGKIEQAALEMKRLTHDFTEDEKTKEVTWGDPKANITDKAQKAIDGYRAQIQNCQLSLRMVHNTGWIIEWRDEHIKVAEERLKTEFPDDLSDTEGMDEKAIETRNNKRDQLRVKIKLLKRAKGCNRKDCWGRGHVGFNISTGEYAFCTCTQKTIQYYNVDKISD